MVNGIEKFIEKFKDYPNCYTVIGGSACDILMSEANLTFRATKDIDMILVVENQTSEFGKQFWEYIKEGGYQCGWKNDEDMHFYRFTNPLPGYPYMIELFSRKLNYHFDIEEGIIPIHIDDYVSSLSAILLNDSFYRFMLEGRKIVNNICVLEAEYLIPFKMYAYINMIERKNKGEFIKSSDLKKHKYDVFRLVQIVDVSKTIHAKGIVNEVINHFIQIIIKEELPLKQIGITLTKKQCIHLLCQLYGIKEIQI